MKKGAKIAIGILVAVLFIVAGIVYWNYYFVYREGTRVGILYKLSKEGAVFKTYEGEIIQPGIRTSSDSKVGSNVFHFSISDNKLAEQLNSLQGKEIEVHYVQYRRTLPWRGRKYPEHEGQYVVDKFISVKNENPNGYGL